MRHKYFFTLAFSFLFIVNGISQVTASWTPVTSGTTNHLYGVSVPDASTCYAAGMSGKILKSINSGSTWTSQTSGTSQDLYAIHFTDANIGYAVGNSATAIKTIDGGLTWSPMPLPVTSSVSFRNIYFIDANTGYIVGGPASGSGTILKTTNAGGSWSILPISSASTSAVYSIFFTSATDGYACEWSGKILKTTNSGSSWTSLTSGTTSPLLNVHFTSVNKGIVAGTSGSVRVTNDAGVSWSGVTSGTTDYLTKSDFYDANNGVVVGGNPTANTGVILTTADGGDTWTVYNPGSARLYGVDFLNANLGFTVGINGTILRYNSNVGIYEKENDNILFHNYPNPFTISSTIDLKNYQFSKNASIEMYNITGKLVKSIVYPKTNKIVIERNDLSSGTYIYKVLDGSNYIGSGRMTIE